MRGTGTCPCPPTNGRRVGASARCAPATKDARGPRRRSSSTTTGTTVTPHRAAQDGRLVCTFFSLMPKEGGVQALGRRSGLLKRRREDLGHHPVQFARALGCSAPVREMPDGTLLLGTYRSENGYSYGGVARSTDGGKTWPSRCRSGAKNAEHRRRDRRDPLPRRHPLSGAAQQFGEHHYATSTDMGLT